MPPCIGDLKSTQERIHINECQFLRLQGRDIAAWLERRVTLVTLRELVAPFGLGHPDSLRGLLNLAEVAM